MSIRTVSLRMPFAIATASCATVAPGSEAGADVAHDAVAIAKGMRRLTVRIDIRLSHDRASVVDAVGRARCEAAVAQRTEIGELPVLPKESVCRSEQTRRRSADHLCA